MMMYLCINFFVIFVCVVLSLSVVVDDFVLLKVIVLIVVVCGMIGVMCVLVLCLLVIGCGDVIVVVFWSVVFECMVKFCIVLYESEL